MTAATADRPWLGAYPQGVPADINVDQYPSLVHLMEESFGKFASAGLQLHGKELSYAQVDSLITDCP